MAKSPVKGRKWLLVTVTGQSEISASQDFDRGRRSTYSAYLRDTPLHIAPGSRIVIWVLTR